MTKKKQARQPSTRITFVEKILRHKCNVPLWQIFLVTSCLSPPLPPPFMIGSNTSLKHWMRGGGGEEQVSEIEQGFIWLKNLLYPNKCVHLDLYPFVINDVNQGDQLLRR